MSYRAIRVGGAERAEFLAYCALHRFDHDESFLSDRELELFGRGPEDEALILRDGTGRLRGAGALMLTPAFREAGKARFRILHAEPPTAALPDEGLPPDAGREEAEAYRILVDGLLPLAEGLSYAYLFLPERAKRVAGILAHMGFAPERYSWLLARGLDSLVPAALVPGFSLEDADLGLSATAESWCSIVNESFARLAGHTRLTPERLLAERDASIEFPGSHTILRDAEGAVVGLVQTVKDVDAAAGEGAFLGPVAVLPSFQGRGLGRALLRAGMAAARAAGHSSCVLTVNSENVGAADLYLSEGFARREVYVCLRRELD